MALIQRTPPAGLAISRDIAKAQMRVIGSIEDALIDEYILSATELAESIMQRSIMPQQWTLFEDFFPDCLLLRRGPVVSVDLIKYLDTDGTLQTLAPTGRANLPAIRTVVLEYC